MLVRIRPMRKVIVSMNISMDGFMADSDGGLDWHFRYWNDEMADESARQLSHADTILLGRKTYEAMAAYWPLQSCNDAFARQDLAFAEMMNERHKIVFSTSLTRLHWCNSALIGSDIRTEMIRLKKDKGNDILVYGSGSIVTLLMGMGMVDEYRIWKHPVALGGGKPFFSHVRHVRLMKQMHFSSGVVLLFYQVAAGRRPSVSI